MRMKTVLVTSVGSLVGQGFLDALDGRRDGLRVVGCNSSADSPNSFRCDEAVLVPPVTDDGFAGALRLLMDEVQPDLVIPGRDPDIVHLAAMADEDEALRGVLLAGTGAMARMMDSKAGTARFSAGLGLPYVDSVDTDEADARARVEEMLGTHGLPLIAKPADGSGSMGVKALTSRGHVDAALGLAGHVIQPFLDAPRGGLGLSLDAGIPLFWEVPEDRLHGVQYILDRQGGVVGRIGFRSRMVRGRCEWLGACEDAGLMAAADSFARAVSAHGWRGPFNVQAKQDRHGAWRVIELNGRFSGGTSARRHLGFDEVGLAMNAWLGPGTIPPDLPRRARRVTRLACDFPLDEDAVATLGGTGRWKSC